MTGAAAAWQAAAAEPRPLARAGSTPTPQLRTVPAAVAGRRPMVAKSHRDARPYQTLRPVPAEARQRAQFACVANACLECEPALPRQGCAQDLCKSALGLRLRRWRWQVSDAAVHSARWRRARWAEDTRRVRSRLLRTVSAGHDVQRRDHAAAWLSCSRQAWPGSCCHHRRLRPASACLLTTTACQEHDRAAGPHGRLENHSGHVVLPSAIRLRTAAR